jgi:glycosyltransferase involved in cell wall biosynthesis
VENAIDRVLRSQLAHEQGLEAMFVGIGLLTLVPKRIGGTETYARSLLNALARVGQLDYCAFLPRIAPDAAGELESRVIASYPAGFSNARRSAAMLRGSFVATRMRREVEGAGVEAVHFPLTSAIPPLDLPTAVTVHDLIHEIFPGMLPAAEVAWRKATWLRTARRAQIVIAASKAVKASLIERYGIAEDRIRVVHHGIDHRRFRPGTGFRQPFLLFPAHHWPHKNHTRLFAAFDIVRRSRPELRLVLVGGGCRRRVIPDGVEVHGYVAADELLALYQTAAALIFPSLYEGFGQPPLEAMACGCPVAAAATGALPETCGEAARLFDPWSVESMVDAIEAVLDHPHDLAARGVRHAARFSWERCALEHEQIYRELVGGSPRSVEDCASALASVA